MYDTKSTTENASISMILRISATGYALMLLETILCEFGQIFATGNALTLWFQKRDTTGKKMTWLENGLNIGDRASGLGLNVKGMDILLSALKYSEIIQF